MSDSAEYEEESHLQLHFTQVEQNFEAQNATILNQSEIHESKLDLTQVILLDNQATMALFRNKSLVSTTFESKTPIRLKSNGGTMKVNHKEKINGYERPVWFSKDAITNIIVLKKYHPVIQSDLR